MNDLANPPANPSAAPQRKPDWIRVKAPGGEEYNNTRGLMRKLGLRNKAELIRYALEQGIGDAPPARRG